MTKQKVDETKGKNFQDQENNAHTIKKLKETLQHSEHQIEAMIEAFSGILFLINQEGIFLDYKGQKQLLYVEPEQFLNKNVYEVLPPDLAAITMHHLEKTLDYGTAEAYEYELFVQGNYRTYAARMVKFRKDVVLVTVRDITARIEAEEAILKAHRDLERKVENRARSLVEINKKLKQEIAERKSAEQKVLESEKRLKDIISLLPDATFGVDMDGHVIFWNKAIEKMTGVKAENMLGKDNYEYALPFYNERRPMLLDQLRGGISDHENLFLNVDKTTDTAFYQAHVPFMENKYLSASAHILYGADGKSIGVIESIRDITSQKLLEKELLESQRQLRILSSAIVQTQENERKRFAQDLHDSIGQILAAVKFGIERTVHQDKETCASCSIVESLKSLLPVVQNGIEEARRISTSLWPTIIDDLGILATLSWFCREYQKVYPKIEIVMKSNITEHEIPDNLKIIIYRIVQESFHNTVKHSKATQISCFLKKQRNSLELVVKDNGKGFNMKDISLTKSSRKGLGLANMKNRIEVSDGTFFIESSENSGTTIRAVWKIFT